MFYLMFCHLRVFYTKYVAGIYIYTRYKYQYVYILIKNTTAPATRRVLVRTKSPAHASGVIQTSSCCCTWRVATRSLLTWCGNVECIIRMNYSACVLHILQESFGPLSATPTPLLPTSCKVFPTENNGGEETKNSEHCRPTSDTILYLSTPGTRCRQPVQVRPTRVGLRVTDRLNLSCSCSTTSFIAQLSDSPHRSLLVHTYYKASSYTWYTNS